MGEVKDVPCLALRSEQCSELAHALDSSEQDRRQREKLSFSLIFKKPLLYIRVFL